MEQPYPYAEQLPYYDPFDPDYVESLLEEVFDPMVRHYFRSRLVGVENIPAGGPAVLAANHSGNSFPYDGMVFDGMNWHREGYPRQGKLRGVFEKELTTSWWMRPFGVENFWRRGGGVDMTFDNFDRLLERGERVLYFPEGVPGIGKGFFRRYQLQRFSSSFVTLADRHRAPVIPVYIVNAEWTIPFCFTIPWLDRLVQKVAGVPFLPLPLAPLGIVFPLFWYLALPVQMVFVVGEPLDVAAFVARSREEHTGLEEREVMRRAADSIRRHMQDALDVHVERYGQKPFGARSLWKHWRENWRQLHRILPLGWPVAFLRHDRDRKRPPARNRLHAFLRDWDLIGFYLPFGWPLLSLTRKLRKPPYGYRGLYPKERREREGAFHWHLEERPLPPRETAQSSPAPAPSGRSLG